MKWISNTLCILILMIVLAACKKEVEEPVLDDPEIEYSSFSALAPGNYWISQRYQIDQNGVETELSKIDSCYVVKDTLIGDHIYYKVNRPRFGFQGPHYIYLRDSLHYLVNASGEILFSYQDFDNILLTGAAIVNSDTLYVVTRTMKHRNRTAIVEAGVFNTYVVQDKIEFNLDIAPPAINPRILKTSYAKDVGIVIESLSTTVGSPNSLERRLIRYHIN